MRTSRIPRYRNDRKRVSHTAGNVTDTAIVAYVRCEAMKMNKFFMYIKKNK